MGMKMKDRQRKREKSKRGERENINAIVCPGCPNSNQVGGLHYNLQFINLIIFLECQASKLSIIIMIWIVFPKCHPAAIRTSLQTTFPTFASFSFYFRHLIGSLDN